MAGEVIDSRLELTTIIFLSQYISWLHSKYLSLYKPQIVAFTSYQRSPLYWMYRGYYMSNNWLDVRVITEEFSVQVCIFIIQLKYLSLRKNMQRGQKKVWNIEGYYDCWEIAIFLLKEKFLSWYLKNVAA